MSTKITTEIIKELRDATGISVMQCKRALEESEGDMKKALAILKKTSSDIALKKMDREVKDGRVTIKTQDKDGMKQAVIVALLCETDFVSRNDDFINLHESLAQMALEDGVDGMKAKAKEAIDGVIQKTGENIVLGEIYEVKGNVVGSYVHNNKIGVIVSLEGGNEGLAKDVAMHIVAMKPEYISEADIKDEEKNTMKEVFEKEVASVDKPEDIKKKILEGKIKTYFKEKTLLEQVFIKNEASDGDQTVGKLLEKNGAKIKDMKRCFI